MPTTTEILTAFMNAVASETIKQQKELGIRSSGASAQSLRVQVFSPNEVGLFGSAYFLQQSLGRRPGRFPPIASIVEWIKQKPIRLQGITAESLAFIIARKIAREGTDIFEGKRKGLNIREIFAKLLTQTVTALTKEKVFQIRSEIFGGTNS